MNIVGNEKEMVLSTKLRSSVSEKWAQQLNCTVTGEQ
jgi:hypothetical protein